MDEIAGDSRSKEWTSSRPAGRGKLKAAWLAEAIARVEKKKTKATGTVKTQKTKSPKKSR